MLSYRFSKGYCHVAALAFLSQNPRLKLLAHIGYYRNYDDDNDSEYSDYDYDHIVAYDPKSGRAYDAFGVHPNADEAVALTDWPSEDTDFWTDIATITVDDIRKAVKDGKLKPFNTSDFNQAKAFARKILSNETIQVTGVRKKDTNFGPMPRGNRLKEGDVIEFPKKPEKKPDWEERNLSALIADVDDMLARRKAQQFNRGSRVKYDGKIGTIIKTDSDRVFINFDDGTNRIVKKRDYFLKPYDPDNTSIFDGST